MVKAARRGLSSLRPLSLALFVIAVLALSLILAAPARAALGATPSSSPSSAASVQTSVAPTLLSGYKPTGTLPGGTPVFVTVGIPLQNLQTLEYLTQQISTPGSPLFRHFLSPTQVQSFLPTAGFQAAESYLEQRGLTIVGSSLDSMITAEGTASQVSRAMGLHFEEYSNGTSSYYSASGPSPIAGAYIDSSNVTAVLLAHPPDIVTRAAISALDARSSQANQTAPIDGYSLTDLQSVYNATSLYAVGDKGAGYTVGILDFYGDPYIAQQLQYYDELTGLPSTQLNVLSIGPYDPGLGTVLDWAGEISLDVESVHAMAPAASIDLYIGNGALPLATAIAAIVAQGRVDDLSQSFGIPESTLSETGASAFDLNVLMTDQYYMLGSAEGMTFVSSTGDVGGSGAAGGPEGSVSYPSSSPYVVALGGTTTYLTFDGSKVSSYDETAWSGYGFVPDQANYGGATGGVSALEPLPWYQSGLSTPSGFPSGREVPDVSLNANAYPGVLVVVPGNGTIITGGTSEASPSFAGLLALLMAASKSELGLINPGLYSLGQSATLYTKVYRPITFGFITPWDAKTGYNLATGWGVPNIGEMAHYGLGVPSTGGLSVNATVTQSGGAPSDVMAGSVLSVGASIRTAAGSPVSTGSFTAELDTLSGRALTVPLAFKASSGSWVGQITTPKNASGLANVVVKGSSGAGSGSGSVGLFLGYFAQFITPLPDQPYDSIFSTVLAVNMTTLGGEPAASGPFSVGVSTYSIVSNAYAPVTTVPLSSEAGSGGIWVGNLTGSYPLGPMVFSADDGAYGFVPILNGAGLQSSFIETSILAEPGVVAPGQTIFVLASVTAPVNTPSMVSEETGQAVSMDIQQGSNVTVSLATQSGRVVASVPIYENNFLTSSFVISGEMTVPSGLAPGIYDVLLASSFDSFTLGAVVNGSYFGQVYVAPSESHTAISISPAVDFQGQTVAVSAKIDYSNGSAVRFGMYIATVYPNGLQNSYNSLTQTIQVPLWYQVSTGLWSGNVTLPSAYNGGGTVSIDPGALYLSGPYDVFVSGLSADGVPSSTSISTQHGLTIQPYLYLEGQQLASVPQNFQLAFAGDTLTGPMTLTDDLFVGSNTLKGGTFTVSASQINGTLTVSGAHVTLTGVSGGTVIAQDSKVVLVDSSLASLQLVGSQVSLNASTVAQVSPSAAVVSIQSPSQGQDFNGTSGSFTVTGQQVASVAVYLDGAEIASMPGGSSSPYAFALNSGSLSLGVHTLTVVATQQDGLSASSAVSFGAEGKLGGLNGSVASLTSQDTSLSSQVSSLNSQVSSATSTIGTLNSQLGSDHGTIGSLQSTVKTLTLGFYGLGLGIIVLLVAMVLLTRRPARRDAVPGEGAGSAPPPASY
ncbi:MAG: protease pro-enzyme activation domain-containing protein [Nitrososphaerales archaeon]